MHSRTVQLCQGLPQGAVLSPLLFLFYIDDLSGVTPEGIQDAYFADDASLWTHNTDLNKANNDIQEALDKISHWSDRNKMKLNAGKSVSTFFSTATSEAKWRPNLNIKGTGIKYEVSPKFLGIHLDRSLAFTAHVDHVTEKVNNRNRILASLAGKEWGWEKRTLRRVYLAMQRSILDYAAPAWQPFLSKTQAKRLDTAQNKALRIVNGQYATTPLEALRAEAGICSYETQSDRLCAIAYEKASRLKDDHPKKVALGKPTVQRIKTRSSCSLGEKKRKKSSNA